MRIPAANALVVSVLHDLCGHADELAGLDAAAGDGDLGFTVTKGADEIATALAGSDPPASADEFFHVIGAAFARGNPSTLAALVAAGLLAAHTVVPAEPIIDRATAARAARAAVNRIMERGGGEPGDKTLIDALRPTVDALQGADPSTSTSDVVATMINAARAGVTATAPLAARKGRAAWVGQRGAGSPDAGATAWLRFLECLHLHLTSRNATTL